MLDGFYADSAWILCGFCGFCMDSMWIPHGFYIDSSWIFDRRIGRNAFSGKILKDVLDEMQWRRLGASGGIWGPLTPEGVKVVSHSRTECKNLQMLIDVLHQMHRRR